MDAYRTINDTLVNLFNEIWELEKEAIITEEFKDITNNDMHIIEAIGLSGENTMSSVAKKLKITAGSLTTAVNALVRKAYVKRERSEEDRRVGHSRATGLRNHACRISLPQRFEKSRHLRRLRVTVQFIKRQVVDTNIGIRFFEKPSGRTHILYDKVTYPGYYFAVIRR